MGKKGSWVFGDKRFYSIQFKADKEAIIQCLRSVLLETGMLPV